MEHEFLWTKFCKKKSYPKNFAEFKNIYPTLSQEEIDGFMEDQIHEFERSILSSKVNVTITMKI